MLPNLSPLRSHFDIKADPVSVCVLFFVFFFLVNHLKLPLLLRTLGVSVGMGNPFKNQYPFSKSKSFQIKHSFHASATSESCN